MFFHAKRKPLYEFDVIVVGSGIAGLFAALKAAEFSRVCLLTKGELHQTNTWLAQGGIAAALGDNDSPEQHLMDTVKAGAGLCNRESVAVMVDEGPEYVRELLALGTPFDRTGERLAMTREGAHCRERVLHAGGDATGKLIQGTLQESLLAKKNVTVFEHTFVTDLLTCEGTAYGVKTLTGEIFTAGAVILATGGLGRVFSRTTNPNIATGDGVAMAYRAGAEVMDMEFVQFHPTVFQGRREEETFLISEAVRGEGAVLRNSRGERFMDCYHEMAELGPRDVVARAIVSEMQKCNSSYVYLDITHRDASFLKQRFPTIYQMAYQFGLDLTRDWLPVSPAAHYAMGGIRTGVDGETNLTGLFACGEVACNGVHGANRLASNSLLEGLVFAARAVKYIEKNEFSAVKRKEEKREQIFVRKTLQVNEIQESLRSIMFEKAGVLRDAAGLESIQSFLQQHIACLSINSMEKDVCELGNLMVIASLIVSGALTRTESRGAHYRTDFTQTDPAWAYHQCRIASQKEVRSSLAPIAV